jgi:hypothetical protein
MKRRKPYATAALEAHQEAGLVGKIEKSKLGSYHYQKRLRNDAVLLCRVGGCIRSSVGRLSLFGR